MFSYEVRLQDQQFPVELRPHGTAWEAYIHGKRHEIRIIGEDESSGLHLILDGQPVHVSPQLEAILGSLIEVQASELEGFAQKSGSEASALPAAILSPMTGIVQEVFVQSTQSVSSGAPLLMIEAMKMENTIKIAWDCTIESVLVEPLQTVFKGQELVRILP